MDGPPSRPRHLVLLPLAVALAVISWPVASMIPIQGLDPSWGAALHLAIRDHLAFGPRVIFTYGPLGFLDVPLLWWMPTAVAAVVYAFVVQVGLAYALLIHTRHRLGLGLAVATTLGLCLLARVEPAELAVVVVALLVLATVQGIGPRRLASTLPYWGGAVAGLQVLVKFNTGLACATVVAVGLIAVDRLSLRAWLTAGLSGVVTLVAAWLIVGQPLGAFPSFVSRSLAVAGGYSDAMTIPYRPLGNTMATVAVLAVVTLGLVALGSRPRLSSLAVVVALGFFEFKHAFVRVDHQHVFPLLVVLALLMVGVPWPAVRLPGVAAAVAAMVAVVVLGPSRGAINPVTRARRLGDQMSLLTNGPRREGRLARARTKINQDLGIDPATVAELAGHTVHVDPYEVSAVWSTNLRWRPTPMFQSYSAYVPSLDRIDAATIASPSGPARVLRLRVSVVIDGRIRAFDSPAYMRALICHFVTERTTDNLQILRRVPNRCSRPRRLSSLTVTSGASVDMPPSDPDEIVYARADVPVSSGTKLRSLAFVPARQPQIVLDGVPHRLVAATAGDGLLLRVPPIAGFAVDFDAAYSPRRVGFEGTNGPVHLTFYAMRVAAAAG